MQFWITAQNRLWGSECIITSSKDGEDDEDVVTTRAVEQHELLGSDDGL